ncbi:MAG: OmpW family protein [Gammaproteobacteria bacterium]
MKLVKKVLVTGLLGVLSLLSFHSQAEGLKAGDWIVRGRIINVAPTVDTDEVEVPALGGFVAGSGVDVNNSTVPELDITYMLTSHWGLELILGTSQHDVSPEGAALIGALDGLAPLGTGSDDAIEAWALPPTLLLQYHFMPESKFRPYVGLGLNYTIFYDEQVKGPLDIPGADLNMDQSFGLAAQIGADYDIGDSGWFFNVDVKYVQMDTTAKFRNTPVGNVSVHVDIDPIIFGIGIGKRF